jgi:phage-related protein
MSVSFDIVFYVTDRGDMPVREFMSKLSIKERVKSFSYFDLLMEFGNSLQANIIKHVGDGSWELRPEFGGVEFRYFYFIVLGDTIVMLHAIR